MRLRSGEGRRLAMMGRAALVAAGLAAIGLLLVHVLLGLLTYPLAVTSPDVAGIVASKSTNQFDAPEVRLILQRGEEVVLQRGDRSLIGGVGEGDLIVFGRMPERWYVKGSLSARSAGPDCYRISADRAYSESDGIVVVWGEWLGQGIRLPKAPGYEDDGLLHELLGHREYTPFEIASGVSFCLDAEGRVTEFTH